MAGPLIVHVFRFPAMARVATAAVLLAVSLAGCHRPHEPTPDEVRAEIARRMPAGAKPNRR